MASPFRHFRKHQRTFMAVAAVLCMFLFVLGSALDFSGSSADDSRRLASAHVAHWNGGSLNEGELARHVLERRITNDLLINIAREGMRTTGLDLPQSVPQFMFDPQAQREQVEQLVLQTEVMSDLATQSGLSIQDGIINHYLTEIGQHKVPTETVQEILRQSARGNLLENEAILFATLRKLLLEHFYVRSFMDAGQVVLPVQQWDAWRKINERISVEAAVLPVADFVGQTVEPTDAQITQFYDEFKQFEPGRLAIVDGTRLPIAEPGFAIPRKVQLNFIDGNLNAWTERYRDQVTEADISDYYERNKRSEFVKLDLPDNLQDLDAAQDQDPTQEQPAETDGGEIPADANAPNATNATNGEPEPSAVPSTDSAEASTDDEGKEPSDDSAAPEAKAPETDDATPSSSSSLRHANPFRLVAFQAPEDSASQEDVTSTEATGDEATGDEATGDEATGDETTGSETTGSETTGSETTGNNGDAPTQSETQDDAAGTSEAASNAETTVEYTPLEEVREEILDNLARDKAVQALEVRANQVFADLRGRYDRHKSNVIDAKERKVSPPELPAEIRELNRVAGDDLRVESTPLVTFLQLAEETLVGRSAIQDGARRVVALAAFNDLELHEPVLSKDLEGNWYVVLKVVDEPLVVPPLDQIRTDVVKAWKTTEAAKLAEKRAKELAEQFSQGSQGFAEFFSDRNITSLVSTELFSWFTYGMAGPGTGRPKLGLAPPLENVGPDFMQAAFSLEEGKSAAVLNSNRSVAYVLRLKNRELSVDRLKQRFLNECSSWMGRFDVVMDQNSKFQTALQKQLEDRVDLVFDDEWMARRSAQQLGSE